MSCLVLGILVAATFAAEGMVSIWEPLYDRSVFILMVVGTHS